jgi:hypothetical protein
LFQDSAFSICAASWSNKCSSPKRPTNCTPIGKPDFDQASGLKNLFPRKQRHALQRLGSNASRHQPLAGRWLNPASIRLTTGHCDCGAVRLRQSRNRRRRARRRVHEVAVVIGSTVILGVSVSVIGIRNADAFRLLCSGGPLGTAASTSASDRAPVIRALLNHGLMVSVPDPQPDPKMDQRDTALRRRTRRAKQSW